jgi:hypothetical protein
MILKMAAFPARFPPCLAMLARSARVLRTLDLGLPVQPLDNAPQPYQNRCVRIDIRDLERRHIASVEVDDKDPPTVVRTSGDAAAPQITLDWDQAVDDEHRLRKCPVCSCRELFVRKDFPQVTGFVVVVLAAVIAVVLFAQEQWAMSMAVLAVVVLIDVVIYFFTGQCLVCYRCRSEFRDVPIGPEHKAWELSIGEKYRRPQPSARAAHPLRPPSNPGVSNNSGTPGQDPPASA